MNVTVNLIEFTKIIADVMGAPSGHIGPEAVIWISAFAQQLILVHEHGAALTDAVVVAEGGCALRADQLGSLLQKHLAGPQITLRTEPGVVWVGLCKLRQNLLPAGQSKPTQDFPNANNPPGVANPSGKIRPQCDLAHLFQEPGLRPILGAVGGGFQRPDKHLEMLPKPEEDFDEPNRLVALVAREIIAQPTTSPEQIIGLARVIYTLEHLPDATKGVEVRLRFPCIWDYQGRFFRKELIEVVVTDKGFKVFCPVVQSSEAERCGLPPINMLMYEYSPTQADYDDEDAFESWMFLHMLFNDIKGAFSKGRAKGWSLEVWDDTIPGYVPNAQAES